MTTQSLQPSILIVEEDSSRRHEMVRELAAGGLQAAEAEDAATAMELLTRAPEGFWLVVTDLDVMPIGGFSLARAIQRKFPQLPVAIVTGQATTTALAARALAAGVTLLPRPVEVRKLAQAIHKLVAPGHQPLSLAVLSETGTSFVPLQARA